MQPDLTLLGIIFGVNIGFSTIDSLAGNLLQSLRRCTGRRLVKYRDAKWIRSIAPTDTVKDEAKRNLLVKVIRKVLVYAEQTGDLFRTNVVCWKVAMAAAAATSFVFMAIPYVPWWSSLLILPVPLCFCSCLIELLIFRFRLGRKCNEVELIYSNLKEDNAIPKGDTDKGSVETRLSALESLLGK
jgi:hypothetical protein